MTGLSRAALPPAMLRAASPAGAAVTAFTGGTLTAVQPGSIGFIADGTSNTIQFGEVSQDPVCFNDTRVAGTVTAAVPEPGTLSLAGAGLLLLGAVRRRHAATASRLRHHGPEESSTLMRPLRTFALAAALLAPFAAGAAPLTFTIEARVSGFETAFDPAPPSTQNFLTSRYAVGTALTMTLTLETATPAGPAANEYKGIVTGRTGSIGGDAFIPSASPSACFNPDIECRISTTTFPTPSGLSTLVFVASGVTEVDGLRADAAAAGAANPDSLIGEAFLSLFILAADLDQTASGLSFDPADIDAGRSGGVFTFYSSEFDPADGFILYRTVLELEFLRVYAGEPVVTTPVPAPASLLLLATALAGLGLKRRDRR